jgi:hypothetical protein
MVAPTSDQRGAPSPIPIIVVQRSDGQYQAGLTKTRRVFQAVALPPMLPHSGLKAARPP